LIIVPRRQSVFLSIKWSKEETKIIQKPIVDKKSFLLASSGIIGPVIYAIVLFVLSLLWEDYSPVSQSMSELGAANAPHSFFMNVFGFLLLGIFLVIFGFVLKNFVYGSWQARIGSALIVFGGIGLIIVSFFPTDIGRTTTSLTGLLHDIWATISSNAITLGILSYSFHFREDYKWQRYWIFSLSISLVVFLISPFPLFDFYNPFLGLIQRIGMGLALFWIAVISCKVLRNVAKDETKR